MATHKYLYLTNIKNEKGEVRVHAHLLDDCRATLANFRQMAGELRQTFPEATDQEIYGGRIYRSSFVEGFAIITWSGFVKKIDPPGWGQKDAPGSAGVAPNFEYRW